MSRSAKSKGPQEDTSASGRANPPARLGWPRAAGETALGEAKSVFARAGFSDATLLMRWTGIAGPQIARIARPVKWQDGPEGATVTLKCEAGAIVFLQHQTRELMDRLNAYFGQDRIVRLKLVPGHLSPNREPADHPAPTAEFAAFEAALPDALTRLGKARAQLKTSRAKPSAQRPD